MAYPEFSSVLYTRGGGCEELATLLSAEASRVTGDLREACTNGRADLLVTRRPPGGFDLVSLAVPLDFEAERVGQVVAAVAGGPHSGLAARLADLLGRYLGVGVAVASAFFDDEDKAEAEAAVDRFAQGIAGADRLIIGAADPSGFVSQLPERSLIVMGEPGGSFLSRIFFGPGARLRAAVPAGAVMVRHSPRRVFHMMDEPVFVGPLHQAGDTLRLHRHPTMAVVENGILIGLVHRSVLAAAPEETPVGELMDAPSSVGVEELLDDLTNGQVEVGTGLLAVTDATGRLVGTLHLPLR